MASMKRVALLSLLLAGASAPAAAFEGPVVRPQLYTSQGKIEFAPLIGYVSNDPYNRIIAPGAALTYHFGESSALDIHGGVCLYSGKQLLSQVRQKIGRDPSVVSKPQFFLTGNYMWTPIYGKLSAFGEVVLHYDLYALAGVGFSSDQIETTSGAAPGNSKLSTSVVPVTDFAIGQHFFFSKHVALRLEVRPYIYWEQINNKVDPNGDVQIVGGLSFLF